MKSIGSGDIFELFYCIMTQSHSSVPVNCQCISRHHFDVANLEVDL